MNAIILDGTREADPEANAIGHSVQQALEQAGLNVQRLVLREKSIAYCQGDFECWVKTPGICKADDDSRPIAQAVIAGDVVLFLTDVTFGGYSSELKRALDKMICLVSPFFEKIDGEVHHQKRYERYPRLIGVGLIPRHDAGVEQIFATLVQRNSINFHAPAYAACVIGRGEDAGSIQSALRGALSSAGVTA